jgi:hypothetical protein
MGCVICKPPSSWRPHASAIVAMSLIGCDFHPRSIRILWRTGNDMTMQTEIPIMVGDASSHRHCCLPGSSGKRQRRTCGCRSLCPGGLVRHLHAGWRKVQHTNTQQKTCANHLACLSRRDMYCTLVSPLRQRMLGLQSAAGPAITHWAKQ